MEKKYELTKDSVRLMGHKLYRIKALRDFGDVKKGDLGGYIEKESNLSHGGTCWVADQAMVLQNASVSEHARVYERAVVFGNARLSGYCYVFQDSQVLGYTRVLDHAWVFGRGIFSKSEVLGGCGGFFKGEGE